MTSIRIKIALTMALLACCAGCGLTGESFGGAKESSQAFATIPLTWSNMQGGRYYAGMLVVSEATGTISVCWKACKVIGKTGPAGPQDLVLGSGDNLSAYVTNIATGHVVSCKVDSDEWASVFKGGHCDEVGTAER